MTERKVVAGSIPALSQRKARVKAIKDTCVKARTIAKGKERYPATDRRTNPKNASRGDKTQCHADSGD